MPVFRSKWTIMVDCHISPINHLESGMGQNTPQVIGNGAWGLFMPHPGVNPGPDGPKKVVLGVKIRPNKRLP